MWDVKRSKVSASASCSPVPQWPPARPSTTSTPTGCYGFLGSQTAPGRIHAVPKVAPRNTRAGQQAAGYVCRGTRSTCPKQCTAPFKACAPDPSWKNKTQCLKSVAHHNGPVTISQNFIWLFFYCSIFFLNLTFILVVWNFLWKSSLSFSLNSQRKICHWPELGSDFPAPMEWVPLQISFVSSGIRHYLSLRAAAFLSRGPLSRFKRQKKTSIIAMGQDISAERDLQYAEILHPFWAWKRVPKCYLSFVNIICSTAWISIQWKWGQDQSKGWAGWIIHNQLRLFFSSPQVECSSSI